MATTRSGGGGFAFYALRVEIEVAMERLIVWPDLGCPW
jgi:hypothetical protein